VLYRALTGSTPNDDVEALGDLIIAICSGPPKPIRELAPWVPEEVAAIVHRALALSPAQRYPSAKAMFDAVRSLLPNGVQIRDDMLAPFDAPGGSGANARTPVSEAPPSATQYDTSRRD